MDRAGTAALCAGVEVSGTGGTRCMQGLAWVQRKGIALLDACPVPALHLVDMEGLRVLPKGVYPGGNSHPALYLIAEFF